MKRRDFMIAAGAAAGASLLPRIAFAEANRIDWYTSSDQNIIDFWTNVVKPKFEAANPGITLNLVDARRQRRPAGDRRPRPGGARSQAPIRRPTSSKASTPRLPAGAHRQAGLYVDFEGRASPTTPRSTRWPSTSTDQTCPIAARRCCSPTTPPSFGRQCAQDLGRPRRLDQGQPRPVHLQPPRQGRLGRQFRAPRHL